MNKFLKKINLSGIPKNRFGFSQFKKQFNLQRKKPHFLKRLYRSFLKFSNKTDYIFIKIIFGSIFFVTSLIIIPGNTIKFQKELKFNFFLMVDSIFHQIYKHDSHIKNTQRYINFLFESILKLFQNNIYQATMLNKILNRMKQLNLQKQSNEIIYLKLFSYLSIILNKIVEHNKIILTNKEFKQNIEYFFIKYVEFRELQNREIVHQKLNEAIMRQKIPFIINIIQYLIIYGQNKQQILININKLILTDPRFAIQLLFNNQILKQLIVNLFQKQNSHIVLDIFLQFSKDSKTCEQMNRNKLISNLSKYKNKIQQKQQNAEQRVYLQNILNNCPIKD